jgi:hypothetical protein
VLVPELAWMSLEFKSHYHQQKKCSKILWTPQGNHILSIYVHNIDNKDQSYSACLTHKITWVIVQYKERYMIAYFMVQ